ncbi:MAG: hypothetical protein ACK4N6_03095 [Rhodocyclaceae bacterium]
MNEHASFVFLVGDDAVIHPLPHDVYVALLRGAAQVPEFANQTMHVADWYVRRKDGEPAELVNETYTTLVFDAEGRASLHGGSAAHWLPTEVERSAMHALIFPGARGG